MKWPKKKELPKEKIVYMYSDEYFLGRNLAINECRQAVEEAVSVEKIHGAMLETHRIGENHEEQFDLEVMNIYANAIRKQIMDELFGTERGV